MTMVNCLACGKKIDLGERPRLFQEVACAVCGQSFVVIEIDPPEICYPLPNYRDDEEDVSVSQRD